MSFPSLHPEAVEELQDRVRNDEDLVYICGPSGKGKSSILQLIRTNLENEYTIVNFSPSHGQSINNFYDDLHRLLLLEQDPLTRLIRKLSTISISIPLVGVNLNRSELPPQKKLQREVESMSNLIICIDDFDILSNNSNELISNIESIQAISGRGTSFLLTGTPNICDRIKYSCVELENVKKDIVSDRIKQQNNINDDEIISTIYEKTTGEPSLIGMVLESNISDLDYEERHKLKNKTSEYITDTYLDSIPTVNEEFLRDTVHFRSLTVKKCSQFLEEYSTSQIRRVLNELSEDSILTISRRQPDGVPIYKTQSKLREYMYNREQPNIDKHISALNYNIDKHYENQSDQEDLSLFDFSPSLIDARYHLDKLINREGADYAHSVLINSDCSVFDRVKLLFLLASSHQIRESTRNRSLLDVYENERSYILSRVESGNITADEIFAFGANLGVEMGLRGDTQDNPMNELVEDLISDFKDIRIPLYEYDQLKGLSEVTTVEEFNWIVKSYTEFVLRLNTLLFSFLEDSIETDEHLDIETSNEFEEFRNVAHSFLEISESKIVSLYSLFDLLKDEIERIVDFDSILYAALYAMHVNEQDIKDGLEKMTYHADDGLDMDSLKGIIQNTDSNTGFKISFDFIMILWTQVVQEEDVLDILNKISNEISESKNITISLIYDLMISQFYFDFGDDIEQYELLFSNFEDSFERMSTKKERTARVDNVLYRWMDHFTEEDSVEEEFELMKSEFNPQNFSPTELPDADKLVMEANTDYENYSKFKEGLGELKEEINEESGE